MFEPLSATRKIQLEHCMERGMSYLSHTKSTNDLIISKEKQGEISVSRWADFVDEEEQVSPPPLNSKLSPEAPIFVPKNLRMKKIICIDLGEEFFEEDEEDNMLDICFDKVARDGDLSPRQQRSGSNKNKKRHMEDNIVGMVSD
ncbi:hypothetical protein R3W88_031965 [Solanum pinnatisectum]|uniref:Uncharacterized protein n=1 Tax=Solanum pinnatisectum TaxID=50273 RepID=A0AAV9LNU8_9SOLN|nr:hypothetical protein R3W88_031965 [Solanum pinnatisectum]